MSEFLISTPALGLPTESFLALRRALIAEVGVEAATRALQSAGHAAGDAFFAALAGEDAALAAMDEGEFWQRVAALFEERGWGRVHFDAVHPGIGSIESADWAEADPAEGALLPSCHFAAGLFANLLGQVAGREIGVIEVECRSRGDLRCRFLFGGPAALNALYAALAAGQDVETALAQLA